MVLTYCDGKEVAQIMNKLENKQYVGHEALSREK